MTISSFTEKELDLATQWFSGHITTRQAAQSVGRGNTIAVYRLARVFQMALQSGRITGSRVGPKPKISPLAKLNQLKVRWAREMAKRGATQCEIAAQLGMSQPAVSNILLGKTYKGV
jgi:hypothetical protein